MRILLLTHSFNSLTQRLHTELAADGHDLSVEFDIGDEVTREAVALFAPDVVLAPFLKRAVPESVWSGVPTLIVHPGIVGDRGPSALDWAIQRGLPRWGVTVLQAEAEMDAGPVWASAAFDMRDATKASLYRNEVTEAALRAVREALARYPDWKSGRWQPAAQNLGHPATLGRPHAPMRQSDRAIDWTSDDSATVLTRIRAADGHPGVLDTLFGQPCRLFDAHPGPRLRGVIPGAVVARQHDALLRATRDGSVWIGHVSRPDQPLPIKLPAAQAFAAEGAALPAFTGDELAYPDIAYRESADGRIGFISFEFYNGAMSTAQCERLTQAILQARTRPTRVLVLEGGHDFWSNGIHLNCIEAASSPADESWRNINAMDDLCLALLETTDRITIAALGGNAGAGGCFLALCCAQVWARAGVLLNPHYKNMGNLYGSEYWTYLLPQRVGSDGAARVMRERLPLSAAGAVERGLVDAAFGLSHAAFAAEVAARAGELAAAPDIDARIAARAARRAADEAVRPLAAFRADELAAMRRNFYGFDPSYHVARYHFVLKTPHSWTPRHLARHREPAARVPATGTTA